MHPSYEQYLKLSHEYNLIPVYSELVVDMDTPISIFKRVCGDEDAYLLESVEGGENLARYSFIGFDPFVSLTCRQGLGWVRQNKADEEGLVLVEGDPLEILQKIMESYRAPALEGLPRFYGGAVGYFGYDLVRYIEKLPEREAETRVDEKKLNPGETKADPALPDAQFTLTRLVLIFDHVRHSLKIVVNTEPGSDPGSSYQKAAVRIEELIRRIHSPSGEEGRAENPASVRSYTSNMTKTEFMGKVERAKEYIRSGDIFQVVLSQRLQTPLSGRPFDIYRRLRTINPAPYLYYLKFGETVVIGSSPEMLVRVEDGQVQTCPIAGTRPRGRTAAEDRANELELLADEKEKAEHVMLVDLGRNDLGKVCDYGSIRIHNFMNVEKYSHVMHLVTAVKGRLLPGKTVFDALKACFPAGTVSGAPKIRAMEIIDELEPCQRGVYSGVIGYFGFTGNMDTCITIRTILVHEGMTYVQAGAGIVADSDPAREFDETMNKARALLETLMFREVG